MYNHENISNYATVLWERAAKVDLETAQRKRKETLKKKERERRRERQRETERERKKDTQKRRESEPEGEREPERDGQRERVRKCESCSSPALGTWLQEVVEFNPVGASESVKASSVSLLGSVC